MQLLEHFKNLTLHPKNAKELKGLILQLAIEGKLTSQWRELNHSVSSPSELLKKIKLYNAKQLKLKKRSLKKVKSEEIIGLDLPDGWIAVRNYDLFNLSKGKNPKDLSEAIKKYPYHDIESLDRGNVRRYSDDEKAPRCSSEDILVVCDGSRSGYLLQGKDGIVGSTLAIIETPPFIKEYIKIIFLQDFERANENMIGAAIPHLDTKNLLNTATGLPPLEEQQEIVRVVEILFKEVEQLEQLTKERIALKEDFVTSALRQLTIDKTETEWQYLQSHFKSFFTEKSAVKKLREAVLQLAVQGKLTVDWRKNNPETEPATELLKRIQKEKAQLIKDKKIKKESPLPPISDDEIPYDLPESWAWGRMIDLCQYITDGTHQTPRYTETGKMFLSAKNVKPFKFMPELHKFVSEDDFEGYRRNRQPELNDILLTRVGAGIGEATIIDQDLEFAIYVSVALLKMFPNKLHPEYLVIWLNSPEGRNFSSKNTYGKGVSQGNLNLGLIRGFTVSLPPLKEQKAIVEKVNALMDLCDQLEQEIEQSKNLNEQLMKSVLREVFEEEKVLL